MKKITTTLLCLLVFRLLSANSPFFVAEELDWQSWERLRPGGTDKIALWTFKGAQHNDAAKGLPWLVRELLLAGDGRLEAQVLEVSWERFPPEANLPTELLGETLELATTVEKDRQQYFGKLTFCPIIRQGGQILRVKRIRIQLDWQPTPPRPNARRIDFVENSVLRSGQIYKVAITQPGIHRLSYDFLKNQLKIDIDRIDPRTIKIYGQGGGMLPELNDQPRIDDLAENHVVVVGEEDGRFDAADFILFYAEGPDQWVLDANKRIFTLRKNIYDTRNFYYIVISPGAGQRAQRQASQTAGAYNSTAFDDYARLEDDKINLLAQAENQINTTGSGQRWYGDWFKGSREYTYNGVFNFPNLVTEVPVKVQAEMALRAAVRSRFSLALNGSNLTSNLSNFGVFNFTSNEDDYAASATLDGALNLSRDLVDVVVRYPNPEGSNDRSEGWLDYVQVNARRRLIMSGEQLFFRDLATLDYPNATYTLSNSTDNIQVWDLTDPQRPFIQEGVRAGNQFSFGVVHNGALRQFVAFNARQNFPSPQVVGVVENQNLHALRAIDLLIVVPQLADAAEQSQFRAAANRLAEHRTRHNGYQVAVVRTDQVYNEFSSGRQDPTAIRDLARMLYTRNERFRYLLLFGDGSYDPRNLEKKGDNLIPTYQVEDFNPLGAFPTDDYFTILESNTFNPLQGRMNIAVGRLTLRRGLEATQMVEKIMHYDLDPQTKTDWRNRLLFVGDDEDGNLHARDVNTLADDLTRKFPTYNADKILIDAFEQQSTAGGTFYPEVNATINRNIFKGVLAVTYLGHGGPNGWAQERILQLNDINNWRNQDRLPLFVTATCSFTNFDNPGSTSAGEAVLLNPRGGGIALMSTVRAVFANENFLLTERSLEILFAGSSTGQTIGDAMRAAKNSFTGSGITTNSRKYGLFGDPSMQLALPRYPIATTEINGKLIPAGQADTLRSLQRVTISGAVLDNQGQINTNFNGVIYPTIFDKAVTARTLGQDIGSPQMDFSLQKNVIFKGRARVQQGKFQFTFVVPKDINYAFGPGKISYYAADTTNRQDAAGQSAQVIIGGTATNAVADEQGPQVDVFMNNPSFVFGGITNANPLLLVELADDNGINVVGNSIGHDLEAVLDEDTQNAIVLNDFFETALDDYAQGTVRYPLSNLSEGLHRLRVKAWDVANNPSEGYTEFVVASSEEVALNHVLNYPNPFTDRTCFQFDHNLPGQPLEVLIQIYTVAGRLVKTLESTILNDGAVRQADCIEWNGRDDYGDPLGRGIYLYKVKVRAAFGGGAAVSGESGFEKLVLLK